MDRSKVALAVAALAAIAAGGELAVVAGGMTALHTLANAVKEAGSAHKLFEEVNKHNLTVNDLVPLNVSGLNLKTQDFKKMLDVIVYAEKEAKKNPKTHEEKVAKLQKIYRELQRQTKSPIDSGLTFSPSNSPSGIPTSSPTWVRMQSVIPTGSPNTLSPSTASPSTASPSTESPNTGSPSTESPNTASPSTASPSTRSPSTLSPSTLSPSTLSPSTLSPSTGSPSANLTQSPVISWVDTSSPTFNSSEWTQAPADSKITGKPSASPTQNETTPDSQAQDFNLGYIGAIAWGTWETLGLAGLAHAAYTGAENFITKNIARGPVHYVSAEVGTKITEAWAARMQARASTAALAA